MMMDIQVQRSNENRESRTVKKCHSGNIQGNYIFLVHGSLRFKIITPKRPKTKKAPERFSVTGLAVLL